MARGEGSPVRLSCEKRVHAQQTRIAQTGPRESKRACIQLRCTSSWARLGKRPREPKSVTPKTPKTKMTKTTKRAQCCAAELNACSLGLSWTSLAILFSFGEIDQVPLDPTLCALRQRRGCASPCVNLRVFLELQPVLSLVLLAWVFTRSSVVSITRCTSARLLRSERSRTMRCDAMRKSLLSRGLGFASGGCECEIVY